jgi:hypothetical protein
MRRAIQFAAWIALVSAACVLQTAAQNTTQTGTQDADQSESQGMTAGNYRIKQSVEVGWRAADINGNGAVFDTLVDLHTGPRLLENTFEMQSLNHKGLLFDTLMLTGSGLGGDPNTLTRLRADKDRWYNLNGTFRRDRDEWDYNLLANPLNPAASNPSVPILFSPHSFDVSRRMTDLNLTLLPQSRVRVRLGYSRNSESGSSNTSVHVGPRQGAETLLAQPWRTSDDGYQMGADLRLLPRTNISYDQFFQVSKDDTSAADVGFLFQLSNGTPADLGLIFDSSAFAPCANPISNPATSPPTVSPICNLFTAYTRRNRSRTFLPMEQLSFQTSYFRNVEIAGRAMYSSAEMSLPSVSEAFAGFLSASQIRQLSSSDRASAKRITMGAELGVTWDVNERLKVLDTLRVANFRSPGITHEDLALLFSNSAVNAINVFSGTTCPPPFSSSACPQHTNLSPADSASQLFARFLGQDSVSNQVELHYDFAKALGARIGYRFHQRSVTRRALELADLLFFPRLPNRGECAAQPLRNDGSCAVTTTETDSAAVDVHEHSFLLGAWARPMQGLRLNFDLDLISADKALYRNSAREFQQYRARAGYSAGSVSVGSSINTSNSANGDADVRSRYRTRSYSFNALVMRTRWGVDAGYDFSTISSRANICYVVQRPAVGTPVCPLDSTAQLAVSSLDERTHFGLLGLRWKPWNRVTASAGYSVVRGQGSTVLLNPNATSGSLNSIYHRPAASLAVAMRPSLVFKTAWGHYNYGEDAPIGPTAARNFRSDLVTVSLQYGF